MYNNVKKYLKTDFLPKEELLLPTYEKIEAMFTTVVQYGILFIELIGVCVLFWAVLRALVTLFRHGDKLRLQLAEGIALALEFKMGGELLRTVIVREWSELLILGAIILLRAAMTFLIHWEINTERRQDKEETRRLFWLGRPKKKDVKKDVKSSEGE